MLLDLIHEKWEKLKPSDGKQKCTKPVWHETAQVLKDKGMRTKTEDKYRWRECSQKWSNLQKHYKKRRAAEKWSGAAASEAWPFDSPIEALLGEASRDKTHTMTVSKQKHSILHLPLSEGRPMVNPKTIDSINPKIWLKPEKNKVIVLDSETESEGGKNSASSTSTATILCHKRKKETVVEAIDEWVISFRFSD